MSRSFGATALTSLPSMRISPSLTLSRPATIASSVDLPQPEGPTRAMNSPVLASRSMPLRTSTAPKRLRSPLMVNVAIASPSLASSLLSLDGPLREAAHEIFAAEEIDQQRRDRADQHRRARDVESASVHLAGRQRDEGRRDRLLTTAGEDDAEQKFVPDAGELPDHGDDQDRRRNRNDDLEKDAPEAGAVDPRRLDQVVGDADVVVAAEQRRERQALNTMHENQAVDRIRQMRRAEDVGPRHQRDLA